MSKSGVFYVKMRMGGQVHAVIYGFESPEGLNRIYVIYLT